MLKYLIPLVLIGSTALGSDCQDSSAKNTNQPLLRIIASNAALPLSQSKTESTATERRGCCSYHGGVCGCSSGRAVCCDGSYSPTCGCN